MGWLARCAVCTCEVVEEPERSDVIAGVPGEPPLEEECVVVEVSGASLGQYCFGVGGSPNRAQAESPARRPSVTSAVMTRPPKRRARE